MKETEGKKKPKKSRVAASKCSTCGQSSECGCTDCRCSYCSSDHEAFAKNARGYQQDEDAAYDDFVEKEFQKAEETGGEARPGDNEKLKGLNQKQALNIMAPAPNGEDSRSDFAPPAQPRPQMDYEKQAPAPMDLPPSRGGDIGEGFGQPHSSEMAAMHDPALDAHLFASDFLRNNAEQFPPGSPEQKQMYYQLIHQHNQKTSAVPSDQAAQIGQQILNNLSLGMPTMRDLEQARQQLHQVSQRDPQLYSSLLGQLHQVAQQALAQAPPGKDQVDLNHFVMELGNTGNMMQQGVSPFPGGEEEVAPHVASTGEDNTETQEEPMTSSFSEEQKVDEQKRVASLRQAGYSEDEVAEIIHVVNNITLKTAATPWWMTGQGVPNAAPKAQAGPQLQQTHNAVPAAPYEKATPQQLQSQPHNWGGAYGGANQAQSQWWHGLNPTQQSAYVNSMKSPAPGATPQQQGATNFDIVKHPGMNPNYEQNIWNKLTPQQQAQFEPQAAGGPTGVANEIGGGLKAGITGPAGAIGAAGPLGEIAGGLKAGVTGPWNALGMDKTIPMPSAVNEVGGGLGAMATGPLGAAAGISSQANPLGEVAGGLGHMVTGPAGAIGNVLGL